MPKNVQPRANHAFLNGPEGIPDLSPLEGSRVATEYQTAAPTGASGQGGTSANVTASGDDRIDGLLSGVMWSGGAITYTDPDNAADYQAGYSLDLDGDTFSAQNDGFSQISAEQLQAVQYALDSDTQSAGAAGFSVEAFTGLGISYGGSGLGTGTIRVANTSDNNYGWAFYPAGTDYGGDAWMGTEIQDPVQGGYDWNNTLHELGHALGLKHGHQGGGPGSTALPADSDSLEYSLMTYRSYVGAPLTGYKNGEWDYPQTYMMLDIAALQYMYGADFSTNSGKTIYSWSPKNSDTKVNGEVGIAPGGDKIFATIWDGGGAHDTYDLGKYRTGVEIDLRPGEASTFKRGQLADLGYYSSEGAGEHLAAGNIFNALLYQGDTRSLIEDAIGGSGNDRITGNAADNWIKGGLGDDTVSGKGGSDTFFFVTGWGVETITDFAPEGGSHDTLDLSGWTAIGGFTDLKRNHASQHGDDLWISAKGRDTVILQDLTIGDLGKSDFAL